MELKFEKYEGCGNDFMLVELAAPPGPEAARRWCDRHFGVGADGVLVVTPLAERAARARFVVINADGSRPEMCGNGLRCAAVHLARRDGLARVEYQLETDAGVLDCRVQRDGDAGVVEARMGRAALSPSIVHAYGGRALEFERVSLGNPHAILFDSTFNLEQIDAIGPEVCASVDGGTNVEFVVEREPGRFDLVVWERGVGRTLACGTGAAATAVALAQAGRAEFGSTVEIALPGGSLDVTVEKGSLAVTVSGPARRVFSGTLSEAFAASKRGDAP